MAVSKSEEVKRLNASDDPGDGFGHCRFRVEEKEKGPD